MGELEKRRADSWVNMDVWEDCDSLSTESESISFEDDSANSVGSSISSSSSSELVEDASSSSSTTSAASNGALYDISDLMASLPIKKGLSRCFEGKSQSFTSLASVKSIEDLAKRVDYSPYRKKMNSSKSYGWGLDGQKLHSPKATISKKAAAGKSYLISSLGCKRGPNIRFCRPPAPLQRN